MLIVYPPAALVAIEAQIARALRSSEGVSNDIDFALQFVQHCSGAGCRVHEQCFRLGNSPQVAGTNLLHAEVEGPLLLGRLHRLQVTLVKQVKDAILLIDVQHHDSVQKLLDVARVAVPDCCLLLVQHAHSIQVAQAEPCFHVLAGFDLPVCKEFGFAQDEPIFITVGRLSGQKNPQLMVDAFMALSKSNSNARLLFVGDGNLRHAVDALIAKYDLENRILVAGIRGSDKVATYLKGADVFVLSSDYEGMPICVLEALACGLPVASTDVGEVARVVSPGVNGELLSVHEPDQLAHAMAKCLKYAEKYRGEPCTVAILDFLPEKVLKPIYDNYQKLAAKGRT